MRNGISVLDLVCQLPGYTSISPAGRNGGSLSLLSGVLVELSLPILGRMVRD